MYFTRFFIMLVLSTFIVLITSEEADVTAAQTTFVTITTTQETSSNHVTSSNTTQKNLSQNLSRTTSHQATHNRTEVTTALPAYISLPSTTTNSTETIPDYIRYCPSNVQCEKLGGDCIDCNFDETCSYGENVSVTCRPKDMVVCLGSQNFTRWFSCQYCYQVAALYHICTNDTGCKVNAAPKQKYQANCTVRDSIICLGRRRFYKMLPCNWTSGKRWSTALILSITLGGFGADRFYLGLWREGIGKLFSFGGLGVWTLVDVVLVATGYITPADGSLYIW